MLRSQLFFCGTELIITYAVLGQADRGPPTLPTTNDNINHHRHGSWNKLALLLGCLHVVLCLKQEVTFHFDKKFLVSQRARDILLLLGDIVAIAILWPAAFKKGQRSEWFNPCALLSALAITFYFFCSSDLAV